MQHSNVMFEYKKIPDLDELAETPANGDLLDIVDVSDTTYEGGTSKKITRANLVGGKANSGANSDITSLSGLTTPLSVAQGGTGANTHTSGGFLVGAGTSAVTSSKQAPSGDVVGTTDTQTLTNKTLTSPVLNTGVSGTAVLDEDDMSSNSATKLATQQSIKAYVDTAIAAIGTKDSDRAVGSTSNPTTTSSSYATLTDMSITLTVGASASVIVICSSTISNTNSSLNYLALDVDSGSEVGEIYTGLNNSTGNITTSYVFTGLSAGNHTFRARWKTSAGTLTAVSTNRVMTAIEV